MPGERRFVESGTGSADLAAEACRRTLADAGRRPEEADSGDLVVLAAFGAGFAWGAVVLRW